jgi:ABC-2 type transport system permease protein
MRNVLALAKRILLQFRHDPRTVVMFVLAPILVLWLFSVMLDSPTYRPTLYGVGLPVELTDALADEDDLRSLVEGSDEQAGRALLENGETDAVLTLEDGTLTVLVEGSVPVKTASVMRVVQSAVGEAASRRAADAQSEAADVAALIEGMAGGAAPDPAPDPDPDGGSGGNLDPASDPGGNLDRGISIDLAALTAEPPVDTVETGYLHGSDDWGDFDFMGPVFLGLFIFVFVFITSSMSLLTERTGGTMERLLATPIRPAQLVCGFCLGFGAVSLVQAALVLWACVTLIGFPNEGPLPLVAATTVSLALVSLCLGLLVSAVARTPFQVIQFMLLLVVPQVLLSGIFDLTTAPEWMRVISACLPLSHGAEALRAVMLRGADLAQILPQLAVLWGFIAVFFTLACLSFKRRQTGRLGALTDRKAQPHEPNQSS